MVSHRSFYAVLTLCLFLPTWPSGFCRHGVRRAIRVNRDEPHRYRRESRRLREQAIVTARRKGLSS